MNFFNSNFGEALFGLVAFALLVLGVFGLNSQLFRSPRHPKVQPPNIRHHVHYQVEILEDEDQALHEKDQAGRVHR